MIRFAAGIAAIAITTAGITANADAQQAQTTGMELFNLFTGSDAVDFDAGELNRLADLLRNNTPPGDCALGKLTIFTPQGDRLFQAALAEARRDAVLTDLDAMGVDVAGRLYLESIVFGGSDSANDAQLEVARDDKPPELRTSSTPPKGTRVKPGDEIRVTMLARDRDPWPTGVKTVQLVADSQGGRFLASENYEPCSDPAEKRVEATYVVPDDPAPIVRLTALAEDHAGRIETDVGEFPTGDWYGTLKSESETRGANGEIMRSWAHVDLAVNADARGKLSGTFAGTHISEADTLVCRWKTAEPAKVRGTLTGAYGPNRQSMSLSVDRLEMVQGSSDIHCPQAGFSGQQPELYSYSGSGAGNSPYFLFMPLYESLRSVGQDAFEGVSESPHQGGVVRVTVKLRRARG